MQYAYVIGALSLVGKKEDDGGILLLYVGIMACYVNISRYLLTFPRAELGKETLYFRAYVSMLHNNNLGKSSGMRWLLGKMQLGLNLSFLDIYSKIQVDSKKQVFHSFA